MKRLQPYDQIVCLEKAERFTIAKIEGSLAWEKEDLPCRRWHVWVKEDGTVENPYSPNVEYRLATPQLIAQVDRIQRVSRLSNFDFNTVDDDDLLRIIKILEPD